MSAVDIDAQLARRQQVLLPREIRFVPAVTRQGAHPTSSTKWTPINPAPKAESATTSSTTSSGTASAEAAPAGIPLRRSESLLCLDWKQPRGPGAGLVNFGNTCYLNSALQCLTHTAPLVQFLSANQARMLSECTAKDSFCMLCALQRHIQAALSSTKPIQPKTIVFSGLPRLSEHFRRGLHRQHDSHEFLRLFMEHIEKACFNHQSILAKFDKLDEVPQPTDPDPNYKPPRTSLVFSIFGGFLQSQVKCLTCNYESNTYDQYMDLNLDVRPSLQRSLQRFIAPEVLDGDNKYRCPRCKKKMKARKQLTVYSLPSILTISLKRFHWSGRKIMAAISYPSELDMAPFMPNKPATNVNYELYGVLVHHGHTSTSGHYTAYVRAANGMWYHCDDTRVSMSSPHAALSQCEGAYVLFYKRVTNRQTNDQLSPSITRAISGESDSKKGKKNRDISKSVLPVVYPQLSRQTSPTSDSQTAETSSLDGVNGSDTQTSKSTASSQDTKLQDNDDAEVVQDNDVVMEEPSDESESEDEPQETAAKKSRPQTQQSTRGAIRGESAAALLSANKDGNLLKMTPLRWDDADAKDEKIKELLKKREQIIAMELEDAANYRKKRERDEQDIEYDRGKVKRVKRKETSDEATQKAPTVNKFQILSEEISRQRFSLLSVTKKKAANRKTRMIQRFKRKFRRIDMR